MAISIRGAGTTSAHLGTRTGREISFLRVVLVLDGRIARKSYGRYLLDSLPPATLVKGPWAVVKDAMLCFYGERQERRAAG